MTPVQLRPAVDEDVAFLLRLRQQTMDPHHAAAGIVQSHDEALSRVRAFFAQTFVIQQRGQPVGMVKVVEQARCLRIQQIQVLPAYQRLGIGTRVVRDVQAEARRRHKAVALSVLRVNPARRLYERLGFCVVGEDDVSLHLQSGA